MVQSAGVLFMPLSPKRTATRTGWRRRVAPPSTGCTFAIAAHEAAPCCQGTWLVHFTTLLNLKSWKIFNWKYSHLRFVGNHCEIFKEKSSREVTVVSIADLMCSIRQQYWLTGKHLWLSAPLHARCVQLGGSSTLPNSQCAVCASSPCQWLFSHGAVMEYIPPVLSLKMCRLSDNNPFIICTLCLSAECPVCSSELYVKFMVSIKIALYIERSLIHNL